MKKVINGKMYNTETAQEIGSWANGGGWSDFHHQEETLYKKRTGEYFLHGEGGPMTRYAEQVELNSWSGGARIMPLSYAEAQAWAEEHMDADDYEAHFGSVPEDDGREILSISITATAAELMRRHASQAGLSVSAYIEALIRRDQSSK